MKTTTLPHVNGGRNVILTEGAYVDGRKVAGIFSAEEDARSEDADRLSLGTIAWDDLTPHQQEVASENSESI